ncbi:MAG: FkbM family methyltransferase [Chloroflexota bacterium]
MVYSRWHYYVRSIPTLLCGIKNPVRTIRTFLGLEKTFPLLITLRNGSQFWVRSPMDIWIIKETCLDRDYEANGTPIENGWNIIDIGAGLGDFAIHAARQNPRGMVFAYEPSPDSFALLRKNIHLNNTRNVVAFPQAVNGHMQELQLEVGSGVPVMYSTVSHNHTPDSQVLQVHATTLDMLFVDLCLEYCDLLKVDCEGAEYDIFFHTSEETLRRVSRVALEYHNDITPYSHVDLITLLQKQGFGVQHMPNPAHREIGYLYAERIVS